MDAAKPYAFIGFGAMDATKPYKFIGSGAIDVTKPYEFIRFAPPGPTAGGLAGFRPKGRTETGFNRVLIGF